MIVTVCRWLFILMFLLVSISSIVLEAAEDKSAPAATAAGSGDAVEFKALKYRLIGPGWGGRVSRAAGVPGDPNVYYFAGAASGVWKTTDGGITWKSVWDDQPISSIGSLAISPSNPNVIYVGSGEANIRGNVGAGNGIYKTTDGGKTWTHVWKQEGQIGTMVVHPTNPDIAFAAVLGHAFGPNKERGIYRTKDGGKTWEQVLKKDENTGASDVAMDPNNSNILFAGLWQARRYPWAMTSGGSGSGLYVSRDGGDTWTQLTGKGLPEGIWGKIGIAIARSDSRCIYALIEAEKGGLFRSDDGGENWTLATANRLVRQRAWYYSTMAVHPTNPNEVWFPQVPMLKTIDAGKTIQFVSGLHHGDLHDCWIDPTNPKRMIASNDGGVDISTDGGESWFAPGLPISQFYHIAVSNRVPYDVAGSMQDIGTAQGPSQSLSNAGIRNQDWYYAGGGEAGHVVSDPSDPNILYAGEYGGYISRYDRRTQQARTIGIYPEDPSGHGGEDLKYRFQWTAPIAISPHNSNVVYHGGNVLFRTDNGGQTWTAISPDLTRNDKSKQQWSGGPITGDNTGVEIYCTIFAIAESTVQKDLIWTGSDDGLVQITTDGGKNWKNVTPAMTGIPEWGTVTMIEPSRFDAGTAYVVVEAHRLDNMKPYLFKTSDFGANWKRLDSSLPQDIYLHAVREDPVRKDILYVGTERGVIYSTDSGKSWRTLKLNMPTVAVHDLVVKDNSLVVGTMGRSIYVFDHLNVLREISPDITSTVAHLFSSPDAIRWNNNYVPREKWAGENSPCCARLYYWLKEAPKSDVTIEILDAQNKVVQTLSSKLRTPISADDDIEDEAKKLKEAALSKEVGIQAGVWDLTYQGAEMIQGSKEDLGNPSSGPAALPGTYTVKLTVDGQSYTTPLKVIQDPRRAISNEDLKTQFDFAIAIRDDISRLTGIVRQIRNVREQISNRNKLLQENAKASQLIKDSDALSTKLDLLDGKLHNPKAEVVYDILAFKGGAKVYSRISGLYAFVVSSDDLPTQGQREVYADQKKELDGYEAEWKQVSAEIANLNATAKTLDLPALIVP